MTKRGRSSDASNSNEDILTTVHMLRSLPGTAAARQAEGRRRAPDFAERFPHLFKMACSDVFEPERLMQFLALRERVRRGEVSYDAVTASIGRQYFDEFVQPLVDRQPPPPPPPNPPEQQQQ